MELWYMFVPVSNNGERAVGVGVVIGVWLSEKCSA